MPSRFLTGSGSNLTYADGRYAVMSGKIADALNKDRWLAWRIREANLEDAAANETVVLGQLPVGVVIMDVKWKLDVVFDGGAMSAMTVEVGRAGNTDSILAAQACGQGEAIAYKNTQLAAYGVDLKADVATTPAVDEHQGGFLVVTAENLVARFVATGDTVDDATTGDLTIYVKFAGNVDAAPVFEPAVGA